MLQADTVRRDAYPEPGVHPAQGRLARGAYLAVGQSRPEPLADGFPCRVDRLRRAAHEGSGFAEAHGAAVVAVVAGVLAHAVDVEHLPVAQFAVP